MLPHKGISNWLTSSDPTDRLDAGDEMGLGKASNIEAMAAFSFGQWRALYYLKAPVGRSDQFLGRHRRADYL
jgi:hypothetical protein